MKKRPNLLFILTDDQGAWALGCAGNTDIQTPNLDGLAQSSVVFDRCYTPAPVCVPARFSLFSGQYCARTGCCNNNSSCDCCNNTCCDCFFVNFFCDFLCEFTVDTNYIVGFIKIFYQ